MSSKLKPLRSWLVWKCAEINKAPAVEPNDVIQKNPSGQNNESKCGRHCIRALHAHPRAHQNSNS
eukprot:2751811-Pyramimonas_sp.AAC.1